MCCNRVILGVVLSGLMHEWWGGGVGGGVLSTCATSCGGEHNRLAATVGFCTNAVELAKGDK